MLPILTNAEGIPICPDIGCGSLMVQVEEPSDRFPGGKWQCPVGKAELDQLAEMVARMTDKITAILTENEKTLNG